MKIKRTILIILVVLSIVLIDTVQAKIFNNRPVIKSARSKESIPSWLGIVT